MNSAFKYRHRSPSLERPVVTNIEYSSSTNHATDSETTSDSDGSNDNLDCKFMYMPVKISHVKAQALLDSGCDINVISESFFNSLPRKM